MGYYPRRIAAAAVAAVVLSLAAPLYAAPAVPALDQLRSAAARLDAAAPVAPASAAPKALPASGASASKAPAQPDLSFTPGKLCTTTDADFKELRYPEQIAYCNRHVTQQMKVEVAAHYNVPQADWGNYEFDHLIPLAIGGDSHVDNLWPQPRGQSDSDGKDKLEVQLYNQMKNGTITQAEAVKQIYAWFNTTGMAQLKAALAKQGAASPAAPDAAQ